MQGSAETVCHTKVTAIRFAYLVMSEFNRLNPTVLEVIERYITEFADLDDLSFKNPLSALAIFDQVFDFVSHPSLESPLLVVKQHTLFDAINTILARRNPSHGGSQAV